MNEKPELELASASSQMYHRASSWALPPKIGKARGYAEKLDGRFKRCSLHRRLPAPRGFLLRRA